MFRELLIIDKYPQRTPKTPCLTEFFGLSNGRVLNIKLYFDTTFAWKIPLIVTILRNNYVNVIV